MIRYVGFPAKSTAKIRDDLNAAGEGATLRVLFRPTDDGGGIKLLIDVVSADKQAGGDCDPTDDSHPCPPFC